MAGKRGREREKGREGDRVRCIGREKCIDRARCIGRERYIDRARCIDIYLLYYAISYCVNKHLNRQRYRLREMHRQREIRRQREIHGKR